MALLEMDKILNKDTVKDMVDEMFNQFYIVKDTRYETFKGQRIKTEGHYINARHSIKGELHAFDMLAHVAEKYTREFYDNERDKINIEDFLQDARLDLYETLLRLGSGNIKGFNNIDNVDDFKTLLQDEEECGRARAYIYKILKSNIYKRNFCEGKRTPKSSYKIGYRVTENGKRKIIWEKLKWEEIDKQIEGKDGEMENTVLERHLLKNSELNNDIEHLYKAKDYDNMYKYILDNRDNIFTKNQNNKLNSLFTTGVLDSSKHNARTKEDINKKALQKLQDDKYFYIVNGRLNKKQIDFLKTVEGIINATDPLEQFFLIQSVLCDDNNTVLNEMFIDLIYSLDEKIIRDLVFCLTDTIDKNWLESEDFRRIIEVLVKEYNYQIKNAKLTYNYNVKQKMNKDEKLIKYIENNVFFDSLEYGVIASRENDAGLLMLEDIRQFINKLFNLNLEKRNVKIFLKKYGYIVDVYKKTTKKNTKGYKVFRNHP